MSLEFVSVVLLRVTLWLALVTVLAICLRRSSAALRHLVWCVGLIGAGLLPLLELLPGYQIEVWQVPAQAPAPVVAASVPDSQALALPLPPLGEPGAPVAGPVPAMAPAPASPGWPLSTWLLLLYLLPVALLLLRLGLALRRLQRLRRGFQSAPGQLQAAADQLAHRLGLGRPPRLCIDAGTAAPFTLGLHRTLVVLPPAAEDWPPLRLQAVLAHELGHIQRRDAWTQMMARLVTILYWFHPLVWLASRRLHLEQERACDDKVLALGLPASGYVEQLLGIADDCGSLPRPALVHSAIASPAELKHRLHAILRAGQRRGLGARLLKLVSVSACLLVAGVGLARPGVAAPDLQESAARKAQDSKKKTKAQQEKPQQDPEKHAAVDKHGLSEADYLAKVTTCIDDIIKCEDQEQGAFARMLLRGMQAGARQPLLQLMADPKLERAILAAEIFSEDVDKGAGHAYAKAAMPLYTRLAEQHQFSKASALLRWVLDKNLTSANALRVMLMGTAEASDGVRKLFYPDLLTAGLRSASGRNRRSVPWFFGRLQTAMISLPGEVLAVHSEALRGLFADAGLEEVYWMGVLAHRDPAILHRALDVLLAPKRELSAELSQAIAGLGVGTKDARLLQRVRDHVKRSKAEDWPLADLLPRIEYLVADYADNRVAAYRGLVPKPQELFELEEVFGVWDAEWLPNGNILITEFSLNHVSEYTKDFKKLVWRYDHLKNPYDADRLANGNTLICDTFGRRVIEVNRDKKIVWSYTRDVHPYDADRLANGNTLICDTKGSRVIEVDPQGKIVWQLRDLPNLHDADRLSNGNTLLTIRMKNEVREVTPKGETVLRIGHLRSPSDADRLPGGLTAVAENGRLGIYDRLGRLVHKQALTWVVECNFRWPARPK